MRSRAAAAGRMPTSEAKPTVNEPEKPAVTQPKRASTGPLNLSYPENDRPVAEDGDPEDTETSLSDEGGNGARIRRGASTSRWVDYDTHELLQMISELEDERRWARLREGIWLALLIHIVLISAITWIPRYIFRVPPVIDPFEAINKRKDLTYLDLPPDVLRKTQPKGAGQAGAGKAAACRQKDAGGAKQTGATTARSGADNATYHAPGADIARSQSRTGTSA